MDAELRIGAMGFEEGYISRVEAEKERWVKVRYARFLSRTKTCVRAQWRNCPELTRCPRSGT